MARTPNHRQLTQRDRDILRDVIARYIFTGEPVSSRTVARSGSHRLSPATIRNVMADLEDLGFLSHPHTSAGRVPTEEGYHLYIESLMPSRSVPMRDRRIIDENLAEGRADGDLLLSSASRALSKLSNQIAVVLTPAVGETVVRTLNFLPLSENRVLCVVVSASGFIDNKILELPDPPPSEELIRISNYVNERFGGRTVEQIRNRLLGLMAEERAQMDRLLASAIQLAGQALSDEEERDLLVEGTTSVLGLPELDDISRVRRLLDTFTDKAGLVRMLNQLIEGQGVRVIIGGESDLTSELGFSLVARTYGAGNTQGALGVFGPSRMEYQRMVPLVDYLGERLSRALEEAYPDS